MYRPSTAEDYCDGDLYHRGWTMTVDDCGVNLGGWNAVTDALALQMTGGCGSTRSGNVTGSIGGRSRYTG